MARNRRKKALYEVIKKGLPKDSMSGRSGPLRPDPVKARVEIPGELPKVPVVDQTTDWPRKPLLVQLGTGRIEFSVPYPFAAAALLALLLLLVLVYRAGQFGGAARQGPVTTDSAVGEPAGWKPPVFDGPTGGEEVSRSPVVSGTGGGNVIVLQEYHNHAELVPARIHFNAYGIKTRIVQSGDRYLLITEDTYENPDRAGTEGNKILQRIKEVGALYIGKAPEGYETFAPHYFSDAYGKKVK